MKICISEEDAIKAWEMERRGQGRILTAMQFYVSPNTLVRAYKFYGLPNPKRGKYKPRKKK